MLNKIDKDKIYGKAIVSDYSITNAGKSLLTEKGGRSKLTAFSLAEMMVVMLIMSIVLAAMAPMITTRIKADQALKAGEAAAPQEDNNPWKWVEGSDTDAYSQASRNMIGQTAAEADDGDAMLILNKGKDDKADILFKNSKSSARLDIFDFSSGSSCYKGLILGDTPADSVKRKSGGISIGFNNTGMGYMSTTLGYGNTLNNGGRVIGYSNTLNNGGQVIGYSNTLNNGGLVIGYSNTLNDGGLVIGNSNTLTDSATVVGNNNNDIGRYAYILGNGNYNSASSYIIGGNNNVLSGYYILGSNNKCRDTSVKPYSGGGVIIGDQNEVYGRHAMAFGTKNAVQNNTDFESSCYALGTENKVNGFISTAIGYKNEASGEAVAIGGYTKATGGGSIAIGNAAYLNVIATIASGGNSVAIGGGKASGATSLAIGQFSRASAGSSVAIGRDALAQGKAAIAIGSTNAGISVAYENGIPYPTSPLYSASAGGDYSVAIGYNASATSAYDFVLGCASHNVKIPGSLTVKSTAVQSDKRLKYIKGENKNGLDAIKKIKVYNFTFKKDENKEPRVGVIAQELQKILPDAVKKGSDGFLTIRIDDIIYTLVNAVKELDRRVSELTETLKQVQAEQKRINQRLDTLEQKSVH